MASPIKPLKNSINKNNESDSTNASPVIIKKLGAALNKNVHTKISTLHEEWRHGSNNP